MALEYSRFNKFFSFSWRFSACSVFACRPNDFVLPKLNLHIKHINIGLVILADAAAAAAAADDDDDLLSKLLAANAPLLSDVTVLFVLTIDGNMHWASLADTTRKEWIFGLFGVAGKWTPSEWETTKVVEKLIQKTNRYYRIKSTII